MDVKPIETVYNGYRFRSRAEARWAVFFDAAEIEYQYEPEGVKLSDGTLYLPDFYLPESGTWFEVKGILKEIDRHKIEQLSLDTNSPVVIGYSDLTFEASADTACYKRTPAYQLGSKKSSGLYRCSVCGKLSFKSWEDAGLNSELCLCCGEPPARQWGISLFDMEWSGERPPGRGTDTVIKKAYYKARQARFEYGETPV